MKGLWLLSLLMIAPTVSGCGCELILYTHFEPSALTLEVGETAPSRGPPSRAAASPDAR